MPRDAPAAQPGGTRETPEELWIVDADVHVHEDPGELAAYADPPWDVALREIAKVEERYLDLPAMSPRAEFREVGLFNIDGSLHAIPNLCPHQRGPLCAGAVSGTIDYGPHTDWKLAWIWDGEVVTCPWHSLEFHVPTGQCIALADIRLRTYVVRVSEAGEIRVVV